MKSRLIDNVEFTVKAGNGGHGKVSFRREKYIPKGGPDGGDGGNGGSIYMIANPHITTLMDYAGHDRYEAPNGESGRSRKQHGKDAGDITLEVPVGTVIWQKYTPNPDYFTETAFRQRITNRSLPRSTRLSAAENRHRSYNSDPLVVSSSRASSSEPEWSKLADLSEPGMKVQIAKGGIGGRGNDAFKSSTNTTPMEAESGQRGEKKLIRLEMKILADIGLVGLPNAGKSTLLSVLTAAHPEIADYPFTTISPNLGVMEIPRRFDDSDDSDDSSRPVVQSSSRQLIIADIPGLIEDAHKGKGLGIDFLRHIERCRVLVYVISPENSMKQFRTVQNEVKSYGHDVDQKPYLVVLNKTDIMSPDEVKAAVKAFDAIGETLIPISAATHSGLDELRSHIVRLLQ